MTNVRTILVPVDFSDGSLAAVRHARELADVFRSHIHLLHVATTPDVPCWAQELFAKQLRPVQEHNRLQALDKLAALIVTQQLDPFRTTGLVRVGCAEDVITDYADEIHADLIVLGLHGERFIPSLRVGHVVEGVLARVRCPVLTIPEDHLPVARLDVPSRAGEPVAC